MSVDAITMVMVMDGDVTARRKRRDVDPDAMQELICSQVGLQSEVIVHLRIKSKHNHTHSDSTRYVKYGAVCQDWCLKMNPKHVVTAR